MNSRRPPLALVVLAALVLIPTAPARGIAAPVGGAAALDRLCADYWNDVMRTSPTWATQLGDRRYDALLGDNSPLGRDARAARWKAVRDRARAIDPAALDATGRVTRGLLIEEVEGSLASAECHFEEWVVDPLNGPQVGLLTLAQTTPIRDRREADDFGKRCRAVGRYVDQHIANLSRGLATGRTAAIDPVEKAIAQLDRLDTLAVAAWPLLDAARRPRDPGLSVADSVHFDGALVAAVRDIVQPAFRRYGSFLRTRIRPAARPQEKAGLAGLPGGLECYRMMIRVHTSLDPTPEELHARGLEEIARIRGAFVALGERVFRTSDLATIQQRLREDPAMHFTTAGEIEDKAREALARAEAVVPQWFGLQPKAPCEVMAMGIAEAPQSTIAYYQQPATDGSRPGRYMINTYLPTTRPRYEAEALAFHEAVPGHHLQIAIAQELGDLPTFRKHMGTTAFVEGWGLYAERLAGEMGLYTADTDRFGALSYDAWRACRLVVDTGLHAMGWTRQQAIDYMVENTVLAPNNIVNEVDRYLTWPGQALAYKVGQREILALRAEAKEKLGARFDIKGFHDAVLGQGAVTLPVLREQVEAWVARVEANP